MNKTQTNHMRMFLNTQETLDANTAKWNQVPILLSVKNNFDELIQRIEETNEKTVPKSEAVTANKGKVLEGLVQKVVSLSGILQAYGAITGNNVLADKVKVTRTDIIQARETDVEALVTPVTDHARKELENLADYGVNEDSITETETSIDQYKSLIGQPRTIRNQAFAAKTMLQELMDTTNDLLNNRLDKLMLQFRYTHPEFYDEYLRARTIVD
ncbi:MAG TPA: hypothetical protein VJ919_05020 [Tangfeifania sp.]|nr:hypothetical protein [Tangfeifania sp.]